MGQVAPAVGFEPTTKRLTVARFGADSVPRRGPTGPSVSHAVSHVTPIRPKTSPLRAAKSRREVHERTASDAPPAPEIPACVSGSEWASPADVSGRWVVGPKSGPRSCGSDGHGFKPRRSPHHPARTTGTERRWAAPSGAELTTRLTTWRSGSRSFGRPRDARRVCSPMSRHGPFRDAQMSVVTTRISTNPWAA